MLFTETEQSHLIQLIKTTIKQYFEHPSLTIQETTHPPFLASLGAFITLKSQGQLRGCIGRIETNGPLYETLQRMAISAGFEDPPCQFHFSLFCAHRAGQSWLERCVPKSAGRLRAETAGKIKGPGKVKEKCRVTKINVFDRKPLKTQ